MARLVLVGLPGVGKSSVAREVARRWHCAALDTDDLVAARVGRSAGAYLRDAGETAFREQELVALREALDSDAVVATGGGVVTSWQSREALRDEVTIWLDGDDTVIVSRLGDVERPLLAGDPAAALAELRRERDAWYREVARSRVDVSGTPDEVAIRVLAAVAEVSR